MVIERQSKHITFLQMASGLSLRSTCARRNVGVIMTDAMDHIIASGYNGNAAGLPHCIENPCDGANLPSGTGLDVCEAIHAEQNALMQCHDVSKIVSVYCTTAPCVHCTKMLMNTSAMTIFFLTDYPHSDVAKALWLLKTGRQWLQVRYESDFV